MTTLEKRRQLAALGAKIHEFADRYTANGNEWASAEDEANFEKLNADFDELRNSIVSDDKAAEVRRRGEAMQAVLEGLPGEVAPGRSRRLATEEPINRLSVDELERRGLIGWMRAQMGRRVSDLDRQAAERCGLPLDEKEVELPNLSSTVYRELQRAHLPLDYLFVPPEDGPLAAGFTTTTGGAAIPDETLVRGFEEGLLSYGGIRAVATLFVTASGEPYALPTVNDTSNKGRRIAEQVAADNNGGGGVSGDGGPNPAIGKTSFSAYKYTSDTVIASAESLEDIVFGMPTLLGGWLATRIDRITSDEFTTGSGSNQPSGIAVAAPVGVTTATNTAFTPDEIIDLYHAADPKYRNRPGSAFMMHDQILKLVRKLKDLGGDYMWNLAPPAGGLNNGVPEVLLGKPVVLNQSMASAIADGAHVMLFGDLSAYHIRRAGGPRIYRLVERYREKDSDGFVAFVREDGAIVNAGTGPIKCMAIKVGP